MKHPNKMSVDHAAIVEAVQMWVDAKFTEAERPHVASVDKINKNYGEDVGFEICFSQPVLP